jgi:uncharacterized protein DUF4031
MATFYVDDTFVWTNGGRLSGEWCHCWTDGSDEELIAFGKKIGLLPSWLQRSTGTSGEFVHFDLRPRKRVMALKAGAVYMPLRDWIGKKLADKAAKEQASE